MGLKRVCGRDHLVSGEMLAVSAGGRPVLLADVGGKLCAYENRCPHKGVPLSEGSLRGTTLTCAAHHWTYDVATGRGINPETERLVPVRMEIADGGVWVDDGSPAAAGRGGGSAAARPGVADADGVRPRAGRAVGASSVSPARPSPVGGPGAGPASVAVRAPAGSALPPHAAAGRVGPVLLAGVVTDAVIEAIRDAHANAMIVDQGSYLRVLVPDRCVIRAESVRARLHAPFHIPADLEPLMCSFKGVFTASEEEAVFESKRRGSGPESGQAP